MAIIINSRETTNALSVTGSAPFLNGNVGDWQETTIQFSVSTSFKTSLAIQVTVNTDDTLTLSSGTWAALGCQVGDAITGTLNQTQISTGTNTNTAISVNVTAIVGNIMTVDAAIFATIPNSFVVPSTNGDYQLNWLEVLVDNDFTAFEFFYNQLLDSNFNSPTLNSILDGSNTSMSVSGIDATNVVTITAFNLLNPKSGNSVYSATVRGLGKTSGVSSFEIIMLYNISGVYDFTTDLTNPTLPSWYLGSECLTDTYKIDAYLVSGSPAGSLSSELTKTQGNTGWFDENRNTSGSIISIASTFYTDIATGASVTGFQSDKSTRIALTLLSSQVIFDNEDSYFNAGLATTPIDRSAFNSTDFTDLENLTANTMGVNQLYDFGSAVTTTIGGFTNSVGGMVDVIRYHFEFVSTTECNVTIDFEPNAAFTTYVNSLSLGDRLYAFWVSVVDPNATFISGHRENVLITGQWVAEEEVTEPLTFTRFSVYPREQDFYTGTANPNANIVVEDDFQGSMKFAIDKSQRIDNVKCGVEVYNSTLDFRYELDSVYVDTSSSPISADGTQEVNGTFNRPFLYANGFKDKLVTIERDLTSDAGDNRGYQIISAMRFRWEWWLENNALSTSFYNPSEPLNNLNHEWISKLLGAEYSFRYFQETVVDGVSYLNTIALTPYDYRNAEVDSFISEINVYANSNFTSSLYVGDKTNKYLGREFALIDNNLNYLECTLTRAETNFVTVYAEVTIEAEDGAGFLSQWKLRSDQTPASNNPLQPITGQTTVNIIDAVGSSTVQCIINTSLVPNGFTNVKITVEFAGAAEGSDAYLTRDIGWASIEQEPEQQEDEFCSFDDCDYKLPVLADVSDSANYKNDIKGLFKKKGGLVLDVTYFLVDCDGVEYALNDNTYGTYFPAGSFEYEPLAIAFQLRWQAVLIGLGAGCYNIKTVYDMRRGDDIVVYSCKYDLLPYTCEEAFRTVRVESVQNGYFEDLNINFKGIDWLDHLRFQGYFGYEKPIHESTMFIGTDNQKKLNQMDIKSEFTLTSHLVPSVCVTAPLWNYHLRASQLFISDYNTDNHRRDYISYPVYLEEVTSVDYFKRNVNAVMSIKFSERAIEKRTRTCVGDRPLPYLSDSYVYQNQCPADGVKSLYWQMDFFGTDDVAFISANALNVGTLTTVLTSTNVGTITISTDNVTYGAFTLPFTPVSGTDYYFKRSTATVTGQYVISGTYV